MFILANNAADLCNAIPVQIKNIIHTVIVFIQIGVPIILIIFGMMDLGKAVMAQKEDEIKKGQQTFVKRLIAAGIVFFVVFIVQLLLNVVDKENGDIWTCVHEIVSGTTNSES